MPKEANEDSLVQVTMRVPSSVIDHADKLAQQMSHPGVAVTRAQALRMLLDVGSKRVREIAAKKKSSTREGR
jgi:hypothetical protein